MTQVQHLNPVSYIHFCQLMNCASVFQIRWINVTVGKVCNWYLIANMLFFPFNFADLFFIILCFNTLSATQTISRLLLFDHFVGLALQGLICYILLIRNRILKITLEANSNKLIESLWCINPLTWSKILKQWWRIVCVFDYSVGLALKGFILRHCNYYDDLNPLSASAALI